MCVLTHSVDLAELAREHWVSSAHVPPLMCLCDLDHAGLYALILVHTG